MLEGPIAQQIMTAGIFAMVTLGGALVVGVVASWLRIPYVLALLIAALPLHSAHIGTSFSAVLLLLLVPALVFEAAWNTHISVLLRVWKPLLMLIVPGVLLSTFAVAWGLTLTHELPFEGALIVGASLAATDPIAVIALFRQVQVPEELQAIVEGESLFNDGLAVVLYVIAVGVSMGHHGVSWREAGLDLVNVARVAGGGALMGFVFAALLALITVRAQQNSLELQVVATVVAAFGSYLAAERFNVSGIFAAVSAGLSMRAFKEYPSEGETENAVGAFWGVLAFIANALVFAFLGLRIDVARLFHHPDLIMLTLAFVIAARLIAVYAGLPLCGVGRTAGTFGWLHVTALAGMRGALSLGLALALPDGIPNRPEIIDAVAGVIVVTLLVQGFSLGPLLKRLHLQPARI
jgi:CPA1 family monovalent cation:H+ antiporter